MSIDRYTIKELALTRRILVLLYVTTYCMFSMCGGCITHSPNKELVYFPAPPAEPHVVHLKSFNRLHDLVSPKLSWVDHIRGGFASPFVATPAGIAYHNPLLYICDTGQGYVHRWNLLTGQATRIGDTGNVTLGTPVAVAVDDNQDVYVADTSRGEVVVFDQTGDMIHQLKPKQGESMKPVALAVQAGKVYVADIAQHRILVFSAASGSLITSFGGPGHALGAFYFPMGLATDQHGRLWVADSMNGRVQQFDHAFKPLSSIGSLGNRYGDMGRPRHLDVGPDGVIFVADTEFAHVHMFDQDGRLLMLLGGPEDQPAGTPMPLGIAIARDVPPLIRELAPATFDPKYYLFISNTVGSQRLSIFAVGVKK